ncbi:hypothetical protein ACLMAJ_15895 [Nocardia sp. KC 131]|uniref:hypothetical protein n=1 Tax=Nocardia arseniciresistens TaxID=3392119 RepID=UPI00398E6A20
MAEEARRSTAEHHLADALAAFGPMGWQRVDAVFAVTVAAEVGHLVYSTGEQMISRSPPESMFVLVREQRALAAQSSTGPWWRMLLVLTDSGAIDIDCDYGERPFPPGQLFAPEAYRADLETYPRARVPVWLAAYIGHRDRQRRTPRQAAAQARADRVGQVWARLAEYEFPPFPVMWARWATIAAAFVAAESDRGPRMLPWTGVFEGAALDGSTLHALPAGRAVLSGGVWNAPALEAAYNNGAPMPDLYAGAPDWVADPVLDPRAASGLLSFCYWWYEGHWYRGASPSAQECAMAVPGVWTRDTVLDIVVGLIGNEPNHDALQAIDRLLSAAEVGAVTHRALVDVFGTDGRFDIDGALFHYSLAGLAPPEPEPRPAGEAISQVRDYITGRGLDTTGYPLEHLVAERFSVGWMVHVPVPEGDTAIGRAIFYLGDDGLLEQSSSSIPAPDYIAEFEQHFAERHSVIGMGETRER